MGTQPQEGGETVPPPPTTPTFLQGLRTEHMVAQGGVLGPGVKAGGKRKEKSQMLQVSQDPGTCSFQEPLVHLQAISVLGSRRERWAHGLGEEEPKE